MRFWAVSRSNFGILHVNLRCREKYFEQSFQKCLYIVSYDLVQVGQGVSEIITFIKPSSEIQEQSRKVES